MFHPVCPRLQADSPVAASNGVELAVFGPEEDQAVRDYGRGVDGRGCLVGPGRLSRRGVQGIQVIIGREVVDAVHDEGREVPGGIPLGAVFPYQLSGRLVQSVGRVDRCQVDYAFDDRRWGLSPETDFDAPGKFSGRCVQDVEFTESAQSVDLAACNGRSALWVEQVRLFRNPKLLSGCCVEGVDTMPPHPPQRRYIRPRRLRQGSAVPSCRYRGSRASPRSARPGRRRGCRWSRSRRPRRSRWEST